VTFSIVARAPEGEMFGVAIASSSPAVAARCAYARTRAGAVASQNLTDPSLGPLILSKLEQGAPAGAALASVTAATKFAAYRQVLAIGRDGPPAVHSGAHALGVHAVAVGEHCAAGVNMLANPNVPQALVDTFAATHVAFVTRLLRALRAGWEQGGEAGPIHSSGLLVVQHVSWPVVDLRVDWDEHDPIGALEKIWSVYAPQVGDYVQRALDPACAASFGVPGDP
jgi:uncharacterized Ntn-hydrolase superfamily protein